MWKAIPLAWQLWFHFKVTLFLLVFTEIAANM